MIRKRKVSEKQNKESTVRTGIAYKRQESRGEKRREKEKEQKQEQKKQKENRGKEKIEEERIIEERTGSIIGSLLKRRFINKTEARANDIAKKYQIEGSK